MAHRIPRINQLLRQEISELLRRQVKDPRLGTFITITEVDTSPDLRYARIFVTCIGGEEQKDEILAGLAAASGFFRSELAKRLELRRMPELSFQWDESIERGGRLLDLIDEISSDSDPQTA